LTLAAFWVGTVRRDFTVFFFEDDENSPDPNGPAPLRPESEAAIFVCAAIRRMNIGEQNEASIRYAMNNVPEDSRRVGVKAE
jgi:hypothetical protein